MSIRSRTIEDFRSAARAAVQLGAAQDAIEFEQMALDLEATATSHISLPASPSLASPEVADFIVRMAKGAS